MEKMARVIPNKPVLVDGLTITPNLSISLHNNVVIAAQEIGERKAAYASTNDQKTRRIQSFILSFSPAQSSPFLSQHHSAAPSLHGLSSLQAATTAPTLPRIFARDSQHVQRLTLAKGSRLYETLLIAVLLCGCSGGIKDTPALTQSEVATLALSLDWSANKGLRVQGIPTGRRLADGAWLVSADTARWPGTATNAPITTWLQGTSVPGEARTPHAQGTYLTLSEGDLSETFRRLSLRSATPDDFDNPLEYRIIRVKDALSETPTADRGQLALLRPGDAYGLLYSQPELPLHERLRAVMRITSVQDASVDLTQTAGTSLPLPGDILVWLGPSPAMTPSRVVIAAPEGLDLKQIIPSEQIFALALSSPGRPASVTRRRVPPTLTPSPVIAARTQQLTAAGLYDAASADLILWWFHVPNGGMQVALGGHALSNPIIQALLAPSLTPYRERWSWYTSWFQSLLLSHQHAHPESALLLQTLCKSPDPSDQARCTASILPLMCLPLA